MPDARKMPDAKLYPQCLIVKILKKDARFSGLPGLPSKYYQLFPLPGRVLIPVHKGPQKLLRRLLKEKSVITS